MGVGFDKRKDSNVDSSSSSGFPFQNKILIANIWVTGYSVMGMLIILISGKSGKRKKIW